LKAGAGIQGPSGIKAANTVNHVGLLIDGAVGWEHLLNQHVTVGAEAWFGYTHFDVANVFNTAFIATVGYRL